MLISYFLLIWLKIKYNTLPCLNQRNGIIFWLVGIAQIICLLASGVQQINLFALQCKLKKLFSFNNSLNLLIFSNPEAFRGWKILLSVYFPHKQFTWLIYP